MGVEWDIENSGKHNGQIEGIQYFNCVKNNGNNGSMVKKDKANLGNNILKALLLQYFKDIPS